MDSKYKISVIVPTYNRAKLLGHTLNSLSLQRFDKGDFEVIVADDGSSDPSREITFGYGDRMNIKYIFQEDRGFRPASARNKGIRNSQGEICLFIDSGVLLGDRCLSAHWGIQEASREPVAALGYVHGLGFAHEEGSEKEQVPIHIDDPSQTISSFQKNKLCPDAREPYYQKYQDRIETLPAPWVFFWTCNASVRRTHLFDVDLFDENYDGRWGCEDNDLGFRLHRQGVKIVLCREAASLHYPHAPGNTCKVSQGELNCIYFDQKFNTPETRLFLETYNKKETREFTDINELLRIHSLHNQAPAHE